MGYIYIIKNTVNDKVYIGQTVHNIEARFKKHIIAAKTSDTKLYKNMREIGIEKFYIETIEECDNFELDNREKYWIKYYDSLNNGYNSTDGGTVGNKTNKDLLYLMIENNATKSDISKTLGMRREYIGTIHNFEDNPSINEITNKKKSIDMYSKDYKFIRTFSSVMDAYNEFNMHNLCTNMGNFYSRVKQSCEIDSIAFGYRWRIHGENYTSFKNFSEHNFCKSCGKKVRIGVSLCRECFKVSRREHIPDIQTLQYLISQYTYEEIGRQYNVTGKTVRKWAYSYGLVESKQSKKPSKNELEQLLSIYSINDIATIFNVTPGTVSWWKKDLGIINIEKDIICVETNMHFKTYKDAGKYMKTLYKYTMEDKYVGYEIKKAIDSNKKLHGYTWILKTY